MSRRNRKPQENAPAVEQQGADVNVEAVVNDTAAVDVEQSAEDVDPIEAALAAIDAENAVVPVPTLESVEAVEIPIEDVDQVLTAADADTAVPNEPAHTVEDVVENLAAVTEGDADAVLAELEAEESSAPAASKASRKKAASAPAPAATTQPKRDFHSIAAIDKSTLTAALDGCNAKKVIEKAQNLIQAVEQGKKLSKYTGVAVKRLIADGKITGKKLVEAFEGEGLTNGTARAQAQQMTALFKIAGIVQPDASAPKELVLADRGLADELMRLAA